jgi:drug/metabolite transporter (DMT)-like permease
MGAIGWALLSAFFGGLGIVLQQRGTLEAPPAGSAGFVTSILRKPVWLAGAVCQFGCWAAQGAALARGPLSEVQPVISLQIVIALPLGIVITHQRVGRRDFLGAALVVIGVAVFVAVTNPTAGRSSAPAQVWLAATAVIAVLAVGCAIAGARRLPAARAAFFGAAAGVLFGYQAAAMNVFVGVVPDGVGAVLRSASTYELILSAVGGFYLLQTALQAGVLAPAIATSNAASPVTSVALGRVIFLETPQRTTGGKIVSAVSALLLVLGLALLARGEAAREADRGAGAATPAPG